MLPINPLPPFKGARPLLMLGLAAGATALALWARRQVPVVKSRVVRVEPCEVVEGTAVVEVPWGIDVR